jgi:hypothetical protein
MVPRTFRVCLPLSVNSFWKNHHTDIPEVWFVNLLVAHKSNKAGNES